MRKGQSFTTGSYAVWYMGHERGNPLVRVDVSYSGDWASGERTKLHVAPGVLPDKASSWSDFLVESLLQAEGYDRYGNRRR